MDIMFPFLELHTELKEEIFHYCRVSDLKNVSLCSKSLNQLSKKQLWKRVKIRWKSLLTMNWRNLTTRKQRENLRYTKSITFYDAEDDVEKLGFSMDLDNNININLTYNPGLDDFASLLQKDWTSVYMNKILKNYKILLSGCNSKMLEEFRSSRGGYVIYRVCQTMPRLKKLLLPNVVCIESFFEEVSDPVVEICKLKHLVHLDLSDNVLDGESMLRLFRGSFQHLEVLDLSDNIEVVIGSDGAVADLPHLVELNLSKCDTISVDFILQLKSLRNLNLSRTVITDKCLHALMKLQYLEKLSINGCMKVTDEGVGYLSRKTSLKTLLMAFTSVTDVGISKLKNLPHLENLSIRACYILSSLSISWIMEMNSLKFLDVSGVRNSVFDAVHLLSEHPTLKRLMCNLPPDKNVVLENIRFEDPGNISWRLEKN